MTFSRAIVLLTCMLVGSLLGCGDDDDGPASPTGRNGTLRFSYTGSTAGSYQATGTFETGAGGVPVIREWAAAILDQQAGALLLISLRPRGSTLADIALFGLPPNVTARRYSLECLDLDCSFGAAIFGVDLTAADPDEDLDGDWYFFEDGEVRVSAVSSERVRGTFSGTAVLYDDVTFEELGRIEVSGGSFDLPIIRDTEIPDFGAFPAQAVLSQRITSAAVGRLPVVRTPMR